MKTSVLEVHDMLSVLSVDEVERRIGEVPGVESVTVNYAAGSATARYDETRLEIADIKSAVREREYESGVSALADDGQRGHTRPKSAPSVPASASAASAGSAPPDTATPPATPSTPVAAAPKPVSDAAPSAPAVDKPEDKAAPDKG